ncbi:MAG: hypothetical protein RBR34_11090, partial [Rhodospirillaceae bacterium]|nr:hypothetical protein [Rhodospirillaceae bacterium]
GQIDAAKDLGCPVLALKGLAQTLDLNHTPSLKVFIRQCAARPRSALIVPSVRLCARRILRTTTPMVKTIRNLLSPLHHLPVVAQAAPVYIAK